MRSGWEGAAFDCRDVQHCSVFFGPSDPEVKEEEEDVVAAPAVAASSAVAWPP